MSRDSQRNLGKNCRIYALDKSQNLWIINANDSSYNKYEIDFLFYSAEMVKKRLERALTGLNLTNGLGFCKVVLLPVVSLVCRYGFD